MPAAGQLIVMGVSGCGKTTVGALAAQALGWPFIDADDHHPQANIDKMRAGVALTDADRAPWLATLHALLQAHATRGEGLVMACSALKQRYRDQLGAGLPALRWVYLHGNREVIAERLAVRNHGYMPASLLDSQLDALEEPGTSAALRLDVALPAPELAASAVAYMKHFSQDT
jgi:gluconokinase